MVQVMAIKVGMNSSKNRTKALKLAAGAQGVISVELEGEDQVKVIGEGVDAVCLTCVLRKKFGFAELLSLQDVTDNGDEGGGGDGRNSSSGDQEPPPAFAYHQFPCPPCAYLIYDPHPYDPPICSVM